MSFRIFLHGLDSSRQGTKGRYFREKFPGMLVPDFSGGLQERMEKLYDILSDKSEITLVGSSYGGLMASILTLEHSSRVKGLTLLAPAINLDEFNKYRNLTTVVPTTIYHGTEDRVIPIVPVYEQAKKCFKNLTFHRVDDDHLLHRTFKTIDWPSIFNQLHVKQ
jgi:pimeloyl-ACP methyl ester carboxylesterase